MEENATLKILKDYGIAVGVSIAIALFVRIFILEAYRIPTNVMRPTLESGDFVFAYKLPHTQLGEWFHFSMKPRRGDVVIYRKEERYRENLIKRVIALPGDTVEIKEGQVFLNDQPSEFSPGKNNVCGTEKLPTKERIPVCLEPPLLKSIARQVVPAKSVFVLSDLRSENTKRASGETVLFSKIKGKAVFVWLSVDPERSTFWSRFRFERIGKIID